MASYRASYFNGADGSCGTLVASARAGNVIGGGDWSVDRIVTDLVAAVERGEAVALRYPNSTRPWLHVMDVLTGYVLLAQQLIKGNASYAEPWNFGPNGSGDTTTTRFAEIFGGEWGVAKAWHPSTVQAPSENVHQLLDSSKARERLGWRPMLTTEQAIVATAQWHRALKQGADARLLVDARISEYLVALQCGAS